jgi:hypothetical protein
MKRQTVPGNVERLRMYSRHWPPSVPGGRSQRSPPFFLSRAHMHTTKTHPVWVRLLLHLHELEKLLAGLTLGRGLLRHSLLHLLAALLARVGTLGALLVEKLLSAQ